MCDLKKLIVLGALLLATPVAAQTCPTRPVGDNSNACASTAFVNQNTINSLPNPLNIGGNAMTFPGAPATLLYNGGPGFTQTGVIESSNLLRPITTDFVPGSVGSFLNILMGASTGNTYAEIQAYTGGGVSAGNLLLNPIAGNVGIGPGATSPTAELMIGPPTNSTTQGLAISQTGPTAGSYATPVYLNQTFATFGAAVTGITPILAMEQKTLTIGAGYSGTEAFTLSVGIVTSAATTTTSDLDAISSGVDQEYTGLSRLYGTTAAVTVGAAGSAPDMIGFEIGMSQNNATTSAVPRRYGLNIDDYGIYQAGTLDTAISVQCGGASTGCWKHLISLTTEGGTLFHALDPSADIVYSESTATIANVLNLANVTVTGDILNFPHVTLTGAGTLTLNGMINVTSTSPEINLNMAASTQSAAFVSTMAGNNRWDFLLGNGTAESGGNAGSDYQLNAFSDAGSFIGDWLLILRSNGAATFGSTVASISTTTGGIIDNGGLGVAGSGYFGGVVATAGYAIASLPSCAAGTRGARAYITNGQTTPTFLGTVSTTGAVIAPVFCNGTSWLYGMLDIPASDNLVNMERAV